MTVEEVFTIALIAVLATAATAAIYLGLLNWIGAFYIVRWKFFWFFWFFRVS